MASQWKDPAQVASNVYKVVLDNERVRVFDVRFKPGDKAVMHGHPDHVVYVLTDGTNRLKFPDGTSKDFDLKAGSALWIPAGPHETTNVGKTDVKLLVFELKS
ncbi:MAG: cupin domain-containing protein [Chloroflexi bacterium]|nr:cupin domain-containing protein [Chloroflexota bacterium]MBI3740154.1 cupin domain-containing protein [Chloroflexota bacterium]